MKVISFVNMKGGVGKTTCALNVADCLAREHGYKVAMIDVDPQFNATQCLIGAEDYVEMLQSDVDTVIDLFDTSPVPTASVLRGAENKPAKQMEQIELIDVGQFDLLPGNIDLYRLEMVTGEGREFGIQRFLERNLRQQGYDFVIIDTPPTPSVWMTSALLASDYYVIPVKPDPLSLIGIDLLSGIIERRKASYNLNLKCLGLVLTMVERPDSRAYETARASLRENPRWRDHLYHPYLSKRSGYARNQLDQPFILQSDEYDLASQLKAIVRTMLGGIE